METKIVVDTSVFVSALLDPTGPSRELLRHCFKGKFSPLMGNALFCEYEDVTRRDVIQRMCILSNDEIDKLLRSFFSICEWIPIYYLWRPNLKDEQDSHLIELAVAGNAKFVVTNNIKDFNNTELHFPELMILTPDQLLGEI